MFKIVSTILTILLTSTSLSHIKTNSYSPKLAVDDTILNEQSLALGFNTGNFYSWNENDSANSVAGIFTNEQTQSYLLNKDGTYNNLDLQVSNFMRFNDNLGIATLNNFHKSDDSNIINSSFLINKNGIINTTPLETTNHTFVEFGDQIVSTDIGADLINNSGKVTHLVSPYQFGKGKTSFTAINADFGIFVGGNQHCYLLKIDGTITEIFVNSQPLIAPNPIFLNAFVSINNNGGIIRNINGQLFYLTIDSNSKIATTALTIDKQTPLFSTTNIFFSKTNNNQGILNINLENNSKFFGQPYNLDVTDTNNIKLTKINEHYMREFILLHPGLGIFIDEQQISYFVNDKFAFTKIGFCTNFQKIDDHLGIIDNNQGKLLLSDTKNSHWTRINTINFANTDNQQVTNFVNAYIDKGSAIAADRTNNWVSNNTLVLNVTNDDLASITISDDPHHPLIPDSNHNITTSIDHTVDLSIKFNAGKDGKSAGETITYHAKIYNENTLPTLNNSTNTNIKYVGIVNNNLYDINSTNTTDGFTINFNYATTIQFVNIITIDSSTFNKVNLWTLKPNTIFQINKKNNNQVFLLQTVNWNNISNWQYFTIYHGNVSPIIKYWTTTAGIELWNNALKLGYSANELKNMTAIQINNLRILSINWKINEKQGNILGYIIFGLIVVSIILAIAAIIYDWYLKWQLKKIKSKNTLIIKK